MYFLLLFGCFAATPLFWESLFSFEPDEGEGEGEEDPPDFLRRGLLCSTFSAREAI